MLAARAFGIFPHEPEVADFSTGRSPTRNKPLLEDNEEARFPPSTETTSEEISERTIISNGLFIFVVSRDFWNHSREPFPQCSLGKICHSS